MHTRARCLGALGPYSVQLTFYNKHVFMSLAGLPNAFWDGYLCSLRLNGQVTGVCHPWIRPPALPLPQRLRGPAWTRLCGCALAKQQCCLQVAGLAETTCQDGKPTFLVTWFPQGSTAVGAGAGEQVSVTYQFWLSFYGFHTKILTLFRGATGHSTFPSRLRVVLALAALSGRERHPWLVTMCTRQAQPGRG